MRSPQNTIKPFFRRVLTRSVMGVIGVIGLLAARASSFADWTLCEEGRAHYLIATPENPLPVEKTAAGELAGYLRKSTGATFEVISEQQVSGEQKAIYIGRTGYAAAHGVDFSALGQQQWVVKTQPDGNLILSGGGLRGIIYSVYEFLEAQVGCYWLDERNEIVPKHSTLMIPDLDATGEPRFRSRQIYDMLDAFPETQRFKVRNRGHIAAPYDLQLHLGESPLVGSPAQHHTFYSYSKAFPHNRPELFSLDKKGKRAIAKSPEGPGQICFTHKEAQKRVAGQLRKFIIADQQKAEQEGYPAPVIYDISANDNPHPCHCEACSALALEEGSYAGPLLGFINAIAREIHSDYPEISIRTFAYLFSSEPPWRIRAEPNVVMHLAQMGWELKGGNRDTLLPITAPGNEAAHRILKSWRAQADQLAVWDYWVLFHREFHFPAPSINLPALWEDLAYYHRCGVRDLFIECENAHSVSFFALRRFLGFQLMRDPGSSVEPLIDRFMKGFYGNAHRTMRRYLNFLQQQQSAFGEPISRVPPASRSYLNDEYFGQALRLLDQAERDATGNPAAIANIRRERIPVLTGIVWRWKALREQGSFTRISHQLLEELDAATAHYYPGAEGEPLRETIRQRYRKFIENTNYRPE